MEDPATWPKRRTYEMFRQWFDVEYHSLVNDLVDDPIEEVGEF